MWSDTSSASQLGRSSPLAVVDLRFLRLLRVFRTFKLSGYGAQLELVVSAVRESKEMLMMFLINLMIVVRRPNPSIPACNQPINLCARYSSLATSWQLLYLLCAR